MNIKSTEDPKVLENCAAAEVMANRLKSEDYAKSCVPVDIDGFYCIVEARRVSKEEFDAFIKMPDDALIDGE